MADRRISLLVCYTVIFLLLTVLASLTDGARQRFQPRNRVTADLANNRNAGASRRQSLSHSVYNRFGSRFPPDPSSASTEDSDSSPSSMNVFFWPFMKWQDSSDEWDIDPMSSSYSNSFEDPGYVEGINRWQQRLLETIWDFFDYFDYQSYSSLDTPQTTEAPRGVGNKQNRRGGGGGGGGGPRGGRGSGKGFGGGRGHGTGFGGPYLSGGWGGGGYDGTYGAGYGWGTGGGGGGGGGDGGSTRGQRGENGGSGRRRNQMRESNEREELSSTERRRGGLTNRGRENAGNGTDSSLDRVGERRNRGGNIRGNRRQNDRNNDKGDNGENGRSFSGADDQLDFRGLESGRNETVDKERTKNGSSGDIEDYSVERSAAAERIGTNSTDEPSVTWSEFGGDGGEVECNDGERRRRCKNRQSSNRGAVRGNDRTRNGEHHSNRGRGSKATNRGNRGENGQPGTNRGTGRADGDGRRGWVGQGSDDERRRGIGEERGNPESRGTQRDMSGGMGGTGRNGGAGRRQK